MNAIGLRLQRTISRGAGPRVEAWDGAMTIEARRTDLSALIVAVAERADRAAFAQLFETFAPKVKAYLLRLGAGRAQADEWVQEVFLTVWRKAAYFDPARAGAATWIFTIARNLRIDGLRKERRGDLNEDPFDREADPGADVLVLAGEREEKIREAMDDLPADQVQVIRLSFFEDRPHSEIAQVLGLPLGTVKSRLRLAMNRLRNALEDLR